MIKILLMKRFILLTTCFLTIGFLSFGQNKSKPAKARQKPEIEIKQFWFCLLTTGPNTSAGSVSKVILFQKHMDNITRLYKEGLLKVAGPFGDNNHQWRGLFIFDCAIRQKAKDIVQTDAAVAAGLLTAEIMPWYTKPVNSFKPGKPGQ
jgi:uncharacterized protein YciI